ncbi:MULTISPECIES: Lrp/AsnC ligand binding domain-containing protein [Prolixibacter]|uniref:Transcriptional regulator n=1 Tax=Prolixibacter denitrificans TaxID=1541063 RepID=A0A2P8CD36_9BACT|nr:MULTISPECIES: Lrp/AsnC ligand binding domain-containing protein [Prolixibacter]PSK82870.1 Lrp/AsnC family transcriptional regulator for asnA, asnC and gidA [Prolixibacter denitrificans]GET21314.1 transcriptional regulator [Prolixibacter denitrificans]GET23852.1 transcriptional regulator [Prolixibacter sp. NT017]
MVKKYNAENEEEFQEQIIQIDDLDRKILKLITTNARIPFLEVARECGVSGAAIHQRVQRLLNLGVVTGSEFIVSPQKLGYNTCAYMGIYLEKASYDRKVVKQLREISEIVECHHTTGQYAIFIKIQTKTNKHLKKIIDTDLQGIDGISRTETFISLEQEFKRQIPIK